MKVNVNSICGYESVLSITVVTLFYLLIDIRVIVPFLLGFDLETFTMVIFPRAEISSMSKTLSHSSGESFKKSSFERLCSSSCTRFSAPS